ncbi:MAG: hypothetical protein WCD69_09400, partial [Xanthobacteraceae bacterium]
MISGEEERRQVAEAQTREHAEQERRRREGRRRTVPVLTSLVGVLGAAIIVWVTMPAAPGPVVQTPSAQVTPTPAPAA